MKMQQEKVYYMYEDHIGRPIFMNEYKNYDAGAGGDYNMVYRRDDSAGDCVYDTLEDIWRTNYTPFGVDDYSFGSVGIDVGSDSYCSLKLDDWMPPFRFPGQYADPELLEDFVYNHWRFYMPEIGRYTSPDPLRDFLNFNLKGKGISPSFFIKLESIRGIRLPALLYPINNAYSGYGYAFASPLSFYDFNGLLSNCVTGCIIGTAVSAGIIGVVVESTVPVTMGASAAGVDAAILSAIALGYSCEEACESFCMDGDNNECEWLCKPKAWGNSYPAKCNKCPDKEQ